MKADAAGIEPQDFSLYNKIERLYKLKMRKLPEMPKPLMDGKEIMKLAGLPAGSQIGKLKEELYELQLAGKIKNHKAAEKWLKDNSKHYKARNT